MEIVKEFIQVFLLFGIIESYITLLFLNKVGKFKKFYWYEILFYAIFLSFCYYIPVLYRQIFLLLYQVILFKIITKENIFKIFKLFIILYLYLLIIEIGFDIIYSLVKIDFLKLNLFEKFLVFIPFRIIEIYFIKENRLLWELFGLEKSKKKQ